MNNLGDYQQGLPVDVKNLVDCESNFVRAGIDGNEPIFSLKGTDKFFGEVLEGIWLKDNDGAIVGPFTALITGGDLELTGQSTGAGVERMGWIQSQNRLYMFDDTVLDVHFKLPGHSGANEFRKDFFLSSGTGDPYASTDRLYILLRTTVAAYTLLIAQTVGGVETVRLNWGAVVNAQGTLRIKFEETKNGHLHTHFYFHDGAGAIVEATDEVAGSPWSLVLNFSKCYISHAFHTTEAALRTVSCEHLTVTYPDFLMKYDLLDADINKGDCEIWDGDPATGIQVFDEDHPFSGDCYIQNGLTRLHVDNGVQYGLKLYGYVAAAWLQLLNNIYPRLQVSAKDLLYPFLKRIELYSEDRIILKIRVEDTATQDGDYYIDLKITLERGQIYILIEFDEAYPEQRVRFTALNSTTLRWGYAGDAEAFGIGDDDLHKNAMNSTMTDNFLVCFDDTGPAALGVLFINEKPAAGASMLYVYDGGDLYVEDILPTDLTATKIFLGIIPFSLIANLFKEAEDAVTDGDTVDPCAGASPAAAPKCVLLDGAGEYVRWDQTAVTDLPIGRYIVLFRAKDSAQEPGDFGMLVRIPAGAVLNEEGAPVNVQLTAAWKYYQLVFDVPSAGTVRVECTKVTGNPNDINVDYMLIVPIGDGESWPQDLAHSALRGRRQLKRVFKR